MKDEHGSWLTKREDIGKCFCRNFVKLFNSDNPQFPLDLEGLVPCCISEEENDQLVTPLSPEEVKAAVFAMKSNKAPGPDANRLKPLLHKLVSPWQAAFTPGRNIQDNSIIAQEIIHSMDKKKAEVLLRLFQKAETLGKIKGYKVARNSFPISHLQFADDLIIFGAADEGNISSIQECLDTYASWSGQKINYFKSNILFSKNVSQHTKSGLAAMMGLKIAPHNLKYLGLPLQIGRSKKEAFNGLDEKVMKKYQGWKVKTLSQAARTSLISHRNKPLSLAKAYLNVEKLYKKGCVVECAMGGISKSGGTLGFPMSLISNQAVKENKVVYAAVVRDEEGSILKAWAKKM
uniref:Reverse transcriptase domain-containing protein n=1 Tax=Fagus sylvatica TaxID=28930 RepID=A0A2N9HKF9_FAGSY